ncbi:hypothetical protein Tco_0808953 [Tanacetum coccineum]
MMTFANRWLETRVTGIKQDARQDQTPRNGCPGLWRIGTRGVRQLMGELRTDALANPNLLTPGLISSGLVPNSAPVIPYVPPTNKDLELLFQPMFDEYFETPTSDHQMPHVLAVPPPAIPIGPSVSISFDHDAPSGSHSPSSSAHQSIFNLNLRT